MLIKKIFIKTRNQLIYQLNIKNLKFIKNKLAFKIRIALNDFYKKNKSKKEFIMKKELNICLEYNS
jgi:hypothetical protein